MAYQLIQRGDLNANDFDVTPPANAGGVTIKATSPGVTTAANAAANTAAAAAVAAHNAAADPHPQYQTAAEGTATANTAVATALAAHTAAADPHPGYVTDAELAAAMGGIPVPTLATVADLLTTPATTTGRLVTDDVLRSLLNGGNDRYVYIARAGEGFRVDNATADGDTAVRFRTAGVGNAHGVQVERVSSGGGHGVYINQQNGALGATPLIVVRDASNAAGAASVVITDHPVQTTAFKAAVTGAGSNFGIELDLYGAGTGGAIRAGTHDNTTGIVADFAAGGIGANSAMRVTKSGSSQGFVVEAYNASGVNESPVGIFTQASLTANGQALSARRNGSGTGHCFDALQLETGTGSAGYFADDNNAPRLATLQAIRLGTNSTWSFFTNGPVYAAGGVTTSDRRTKGNISSIDGARALEFYKRITWATFDKYTDAASLEAGEAAMQGAARDTRRRLEARLAEMDADGNGQVSDEERAQYQTALKRARSAENRKVSRAPSAQLVGRQAGVIAQDLQHALRDFPEFAFLVKLTDPMNPNSTLVVDYTSLQAIINAAVQFKLFSA